MKKQLLTILLLGAILFTSCKEQNKQQNTESVKTETTAADDVVLQSLTDKEGNTLGMTFDNAKDVVAIKFKGDTSTLSSQKPASGIWYKNEHFELSGKGNDIQLTKDGKVIFKHKDDIVAIEAKNNTGDVLNITFNHTQGTAKAYQNGGEQIDLSEQKLASGIGYKNEHYELSVKGDKYELVKDGKIIFQN